MKMFGTTRAGKSCIGRTILMQYLSQPDSAPTVQEKLEGTLLPACAIVVLPPPEHTDEQQSETLWQ